MDASIWRILDANSNRAREALRVIEEFARFTLADRGLTAAAKDLRHALVAALQPLEAERAMAMRDTPSDVGTTLTGAGEYKRQSGGDVVRAASKRLNEAIRVLEEYGKVLDAAMSVAIEGVRYRAYDLEKRVQRVTDAQARFGGVRLYVLITEALCTHAWQEVMRHAAKGGADCIQLREPELDDRALLARAVEFCTLCRELGVLCIINNRADVAAAAKADGVHLGQRDLPIDAARRIVGPQGIIGASTHTTAEANAGIAKCPDYIAVGPMFATQVKPDYGVAGPEYLRMVRGETAIPLVAIGGINPSNVAAVVEAGAMCVAVCTAIIGSADVESAARDIRNQLPDG